MTVLDFQALRDKYAQERDKRIRSDGNEQYLEITGQFGHYLDDPYVARVEREPKRDHVTVAVIGGGFAGLLTGARLKEAGIDDVRMIDKAGDFGGTWYWNRYPGAQCDTASMIYLPLLEETGHVPTERYVHAPEILEHCQRIGNQFDLYENALFHTKVTDLEWDEARTRWIVRTDRGDDFTAQFVATGTGPLHVPKLPGIPGIESFAGHSFHTSRWDYEYTGGDEQGAPLDRLADKRVAIIGTGATSIQCVPHLAQTCGELFVFQRTPSSVDVRANGPIDTEWFATQATPGWQQRWLENFAANMTPFEPAEEDLVNDGWTDLAKRMRGRLAAPPPGGLGVADLIAEMEHADFEKMEEIRSRVNTVVSDVDTAENLKAWYRQLCKRPCFHDEYLDAYNRPSVHLVHTDGQGVERITPDGVVVAGVEYKVDCIIYASGFEVGTEPTRRQGYDMTGTGGVALSSYWAEGMRSLHGIHVRGFPNVFLVQLFQGASFVANVPHNLVDSAKTIAAIVGHMNEAGIDRVEVSEEAERAWMQGLVANPMIAAFLTQCTPGYYNNEGKEFGPHNFFVTGYPFGPVAYFRYIEQWRNSGDFAGLEFAQAASASI